jgi:proteasome beta subunit
MGFELPIGGTALGIKANKGIVLASEKRLAYGYTILSKSAKKIYPLNDRVAVAFAGLVGDMQALVRRLQSLIHLYEFENSTLMSTRSVAKLLSVILFEAKFTPYFTQTIIGGKDNEGYHLYSLDPLGSLLEENYVAVGSGAPIAIGIVESEYNPNVDTDALVLLAKKALKQTVSRDIESGDGIDLAIIDNDRILESTFPVKAL